MENPATKLRIELEESAKGITKAHERLIEAFEDINKSYQGIKNIHLKILEIEKALNEERVKS